MNETERSARQVCEDHLREEIRYNRDHKIMPSEVVVAERMLAHGDQLREFYGEIYPTLNHDGMAWKHALHCALYVGAFWTPGRIAARRADRQDLVAINEAISRSSHALADLLDRRTALYERSGFGADTHYAIYDVIDAAGKNNGHYQSYLKEQLQAAQRFDLKYWPSLSECIRVIGSDAQQAEVVPDNALTDAATHSSRPSKADFVRALLASIEDHRGDHQGGIPTTFEFTNSALADLVNVLLELPPKELVTEEYLKTERHRARRRAEQND